jgi:hypothetical protein
MWDEMANEVVQHEPPDMCECTLRTRRATTDLDPLHLGTVATVP